jgi:Leucine-rich repeat (LRR) protein
MFEIGGFSYAFTCLNLDGKNVQEITDVLGSYKHLREINLSNNDLLDIAEVLKLDYLTKL